MHLSDLLRLHPHRDSNEVSLQQIHMRGLSIVDGHTANSITFSEAVALRITSSDGPRRQEPGVKGAFFCMW